MKLAHKIMQLIKFVILTKHCLILVLTMVLLDHVDQPEWSRACFAC